MLKVYLSGSIRVSFDDADPVAFRTRKALAIFAYLALLPDPIPRAKVIEIFWPEMTTSQALKNLRTTLTELRQLLGDYILATPKQLSFNRKLSYWTDFHQLIAVLSDLSLIDEKRFQFFEEHYQGELMSSLAVTNSPTFEHWLQQVRDDFQQTVTSAISRWTAQTLTNQTYKLGLRISQKWLELEPWNETAHRLRMQIFWQSGQRSAALLQYNICCDYLEKELDVEPSDETKQLYVQIQRDVFTSNSSVATRPKATDNIIPNNIPRQLLRFTGRDQEMAQVLHQLLTQKRPLVSIIGEGGVGKTSLALAVADKLIKEGHSNRYPNGVWFVACVGIEANLSAQEQLIITIASAIGLNFQSSKPPEQQLLDYLNNKELLLILDNFEQLTAQSGFLLTLLQQNYHLQILLTSRHDLLLSSDWKLLLTGLQLPPEPRGDLYKLVSESELAQTHAAASIQLLQERAQSNGTDFRIEQQNANIAAALCHLLDGNPLAIELAATLLAFYDLPSLFQELNHNYHLLTNDLQNLPPRQRSIYATIDFSWQLLPPELAELMAQCSVFRGSFTLSALMTITQVSQSLVQQLIRRSLVHLDEKRNLHVHEMVRQFAAEKLADEPERQTITQYQHSNYYLQQLIDWWEKAETKHLPQSLLTSLDNIYAAWDWSFQQQHYALLCRSIIAFVYFHINASLVSDTLKRIEHYRQQLNTIIDKLEDENARAAYREIETVLLFAHASFRYCLADYTSVAKLFAQVQGLAEQHGYHYLLAETNLRFATIHRLAHELNKSKESCERAIYYAKKYRQPYTETYSLFALILLLNQMGQHEQANTTLQEILPLLQQHPDVILESVYHGYNGTIQHALGRWSAALASYLQVSALVRQFRNPTHENHGIGKLLWQSGRYKEAKEYLERIDDSPKAESYAIGSYWHTVWLVDFANLYIAWQEPEQALFYSRLATKQAEKLDNMILLGRALRATGAAQLQLEEDEPATKNLTEARQLFQQHNAPDFEATALTQLILLAISQEEPEKVALYSEALWQLLASDGLDMTNAEPSKAYWACYCGFLFINDERYPEALRRTQTIFEKQLSNIDDVVWRGDFATQIYEHRQLQSILSMKSA